MAKWPSACMYTYKYTHTHRKMYKKEKAVLLFDRDDQMLWKQWYFKLFFLNLGIQFTFSLLTWFSEHSPIKQIYHTCPMSYCYANWKTLGPGLWHTQYFLTLRDREFPPFPSASFVVIEVPALFSSPESCCVAVFLIIPLSGRAHTGKCVCTH